MNIFDEAEIRVASLASGIQSPSESGIGPTTTSSSVCVSVFDFVLTFTLGASAAFPVVLNLDDRNSYHDDSGDGNFVLPAVCWRPHRLHVVMHDNPSMICARGAVLLDGELGRGRLTAAFSFSTATAWGHVSWRVRWGNYGCNSGRRLGHGWGGVRVLRVTRGPVPKKPFCVLLYSHRCCGHTMTCRKEGRA